MASINLWVDEFTENYLEWMDIGYKPFLNDNVNWKVYSSVATKIQGYFKFEGLEAGSVSQVVLWMEGYGGDIGNGYGNTAYDIYLSTIGQQYDVIGRVIPDSPYDTWYNFDVSEFVDTPAKLNNVDIFLKTVNIGSPKVNYVYAQRCYLSVVYSFEAEEYDCNYIGLNNTKPDKITKFSCEWTDLNQSEGLSHFRFSTNNTGTWINDTWSNSWQNVVWAEATKTLNSTVGLIIAFRFYVNDTSGIEYRSTTCFFKSSSGFGSGFGSGFIIAIMIGVVFALSAIVYKKRK